MFLRPADHHSFGTEGVTNLQNVVREKQNKTGANQSELTDREIFTADSLAQISAFYLDPQVLFH